MDKAWHFRSDVARILESFTSMLTKIINSHMIIEIFHIIVEMGSLQI
jgi:hypothetical protein